MGRTNPTYREWLRRFEERWQSYRRALRRRSQDAFDRLFEQARQHADAAGYQNTDTPEIALLFSMILAHERRLDALEDEDDGPTDDGRDDDGASGR